MTPVTAGNLGAELAEEDWALLETELCALLELGATLLLSDDAACDDAGVDETGADEVCADETALEVLTELGGTMTGADEIGAGLESALLAGVLEGGLAGVDETGIEVVSELGADAEVPGPAGSELGAEVTSLATDLLLEVGAGLDTVTEVGRLEDAGELLLPPPPPPQAPSIRLHADSATKIFAFIFFS